MKIIGCDFHPGYQQIAVLDLATGEMVEKALSHDDQQLLEITYRNSACQTSVADVMFRDIFNEPFAEVLR